MYYEPFLTFHKNAEDTFTHPLQINLPEEIHLLTLKKIESQLGDDDVFLILRLEHIYSSGSLLHMLILHTI